MTSVAASRPQMNSNFLVPALFAVFKLLLHLPILTRYGFHPDELYFIACGRHLSFGYVDHAPMIPWIARLATELFGDSLFGLRFVAVLGGAAALFMVGILTRRLGGGRFAQSLACLAMLIAPVYLRTGNMLAIPSFEPLIWCCCFYLLLRILQGGGDRDWAYLGIAIGVGLMTKHSMLFFGAGLAVAMMLTPLRAQFRTRGPYLAAGLALLVFSPNVVWQIQNSWPTIGFLVDLNASVMSRISPFDFLFGQLLYLHPLAAVIWIWGIVYFFRRGRQYRLFAWLWISIFVLLLLGKSKIYYLAPAYPILLAGGAIAFEQMIERTRRSALRPVALAALAAGGVALLPASVPIFSLQTAEAWMGAVTMGQLGEVHELTGDLRAMFGWEERLDAIGAAHDSLSDAEKKDAIIFAPGYGMPGAIDLTRPDTGLPPAYSMTLNYWLWGPPADKHAVVITAGFSAAQLEGLFEDIQTAQTIELGNVDPSDARFEVLICRRPTKTLASIWPKNRPW